MAHLGDRESQVQSSSQAGRSGSRGGSRCSSRGSTQSEFIRGILVPPKPTLPHIFVNLKYRPDELTSSNQKWHNWNNQHDAQMFSMKEPTIAVPAGVEEDHFGQGFRRARDWKGRIKGELCEYQRQVWSKCGKHVAT